MNLFSSFFVYHDIGEGWSGKVKCAVAASVGVAEIFGTAQVSILSACYIGNALQGGKSKQAPRSVG